MPPSLVLQVAGGEHLLTTAQDGTAKSAEKEAPRPPLTRSCPKNKATERRQIGKTELVTGIQHTRTMLRVMFSL